MGTKTTQWYILVNGHPEGPFTVLEVAKKIRSGKVIKKDLLFRAGASKWKAAQDYDEFKEFFKLKSHRPKRDEWVVLLRKDKVTGRRFHQIGPLTTQEITEGIKKQSISPRDYVWQDGMTAWQRIAKTKNFAGITREDKKSTLKLVNNDQEITKVNISPKKSKETRPEEAEGDDLATELIDFKALKGQKIFTEVNKKIKVIEEKTESAKEKVKVALETAEDSFVQKTVKPISKQNALEKILLSRYMLASVVLLLFVATGLLVWKLKGPQIQKQVKLATKKVVEVKNEIESRSFKVKDEKQVSKKQGVNAITSDARKKSTTRSESRKAETRKAPTYLKFYVRKKSSKNVKFFISSDGSSHFDIWLFFYSKVGQVKGLKSYYWVKRLKKPVNEKSMTVDVGDFNLPDGTYDVIVKVGPLEEAKKLVYGDLNKSFRRAVSVYRKQNSMYITKEKKRLYVSSRRLLRLGRDLAKEISKSEPSSASWGKFYRRLSKKLADSKRKEFRSLSSSRSPKLYFPMAWKVYKDRLGELNRLARDMNNAKQKRSFLSKVQQTVDELEDTRNSMASLSSW